MTKKEETGLTVVPEYMKKELMSNEGNENITRDDITVPRILQAQALSPQCDESDPKYIPGLKPGALFNSITNEMYPDPMVVCLFAFQKTYPVYRQREHGGGFLGVYGSESEAKDEIDQMDNPKECEIIETAVHWLFAQRADGEWEEAAIHMASTKMTTSRNLNSLVRLRGGARWSHLYSLSSKQDEISGKGKFYRLMAKNHDGWPPEEIVKKAKEYHLRVMDKDIKTDYGKETEAPESTEF